MRHALKIALVFATLFIALPAPAATDAAPAAVVVEEAKVEQPVAPAVSPTPAPTEASAIVGIVQSAHQGNWKLAMAGLLSLLVLVIRKLNLHTIVPFFKGDRGGSILVMVMAVVGALGSALSTPGMHITVDTFVAAIGVGLTSVGGYHWLGNMLNPADKAKPPA